MFAQSREVGASRYEADIASTLCQSRTEIAPDAACTHDCYLHPFPPVRAPLAWALALTFWFFLAKSLSTVNGHWMFKSPIEVEIENIQSRIRGSTLVRKWFVILLKNVSRHQ